MSHKITRLMLSNWMSLKLKIFEMSDIVFITGGNGSGKSTIIDAFSLIYGAEFDTMLNLTGDERRSAAGAIHWTTPNGQKRPGDTVSYIIMEAVDDDGAYYHQGIRMRSRHNSNKVDDKVYFQGEGRLEDIGATQERHVLTGNVIMQESGTSREEMFRRFFIRRGYPSDSFVYAKVRGKDSVARFREMSRSILTNEGIRRYKSISEYAQSQIFPETSTKSDLDEVMQDLHNLTEIVRTIRENEKKLSVLSAIILKSKAYLGTKKDRELVKIAMPYVNIGYYGQKIADAKTEMSSLRSQEKALQEQVAACDRELDRMLMEKGSILGAEDPAREIEMRLKEECSELYDLELKVNNKQKYDAAGQFLAEHVDRFEEGGESAAYDKLVSVQTEIRSLHNEIALMQKKKNDAFAQLQTLSGRKKNTDAGGYLASMLDDARRLQAELRKQIRGSEPLLLMDCVSEVLKPEWQEAAESIIGNDRFGIVIEPEHYAKACLIQHEMNNSRDVIVLDTRKTAERGAGNVPSVFTYQNRYAEGYLNFAYGDCMLCETDEEFTRAKRGVRKNGQFKTGLRSIKPGRTRKVTCFFGHKAIAAEKERITEMISRLDEDIRVKEQELLRQDVLTDELKENIRIFTSMAPEEDAGLQDKYAAKKAVVNDLMRELEEAEHSDARAIKQQKAAELENEIEKKKASKAGAEHECARLDMQIKSIQAGIDADRRHLAEYEAMEGAGERILPEEKAYFTEKGWDVSLCGENSRRVISDIEKDYALSRSKLENEFIQAGDLLNCFIELPDFVETDNDLQLYDREYRNLKDLMDGGDDIAVMERLKKSTRDHYALLLGKMNAEYEQAQKIREQFNQVIGTCKIGMCYYRLGPLSVSQVRENHEIMNLAIRQRNNYTLTEDDIAYIDEVCGRYIADDRGVISNPFDYKLYIETCMEYRTDSVEKWANADRVNQTNSNGQQSILRYILKFAIMASQAFSDKGLRFIMCDEALQGVDDSNKKYFFHVLRQMDIQCLLVSMDQRFIEDAKTAYIFRMYNGEHIRIEKFVNRGK